MAGQPSAAGQPFVLLGTVIRPHGIKGELKVRPFTEQPKNIAQFARLLLAVDESTEKQVYTTEQVRVSGALVILRLRECTSRELAESLVGQRIWVASSDLPPVTEGEFYLHTMLGKAVQTVDGHLLGQADHLLAGSSQDILVVKQGNQEHLIPIVRAFIHSIESDVVILDLPEGLLDINR